MPLDDDYRIRATVDRLWRAYAPYQRGQDVSRDLPALLAILTLYRRAQADDGYVAEQWRRAVAHARNADRTLAELSDAVHALQDEIPDGVVSSATGRGGHDVPWVGAVVRAVENSRLSSHEVGTVFDLLLERMVRDGSVQFGEFFTPAEVSRLAAAIAAPSGGESVLDPACGQGAFINAASQHTSGSTIPGATYQARSLTQSSGDVAALSFMVHDVAVDLRGPGSPNPGSSEETRENFDVVLGNPPFNQPFLDHAEAAPYPYGEPPSSNANFAWLQLALSSLTPTGRAVMLMPPVAGASDVPQEAAIRRRMLDNDVIACVIALPPRLFPGTGIAPHMWVMTSEKQATCPGRSGEVLFIDASGLGEAVGRTQRVLTEADHTRILDCYEGWASRGRWDYADEPGFCRSVGLTEIGYHQHRLSPPLFVGPPSTEQGPSAAAVPQVLDKIERIESESRHIRDEIRSIMETAQAKTSGSVTYRSLAELVVSTYRDGITGILSGPSGSVLSAAHYTDTGEVPVIMPRDIGDNQFNLALAARVTEEKAQELDRFRLLPGDVIIARRGEFGRRSLVRAENAGWLCGTGCIRIRPSADIDPRYLAVYLGRPEVRDWLTQHASATTTLPSFTAATLMRLPVLLPPAESQTTVAAVADLIAEHQRMVHQTEDALGALRHTTFADLLAAEIHLGTG